MSKEMRENERNIRYDMLDLNYQYLSQGILSAIHQKITWIEKSIIHVVGGPEEENQDYSTNQSQSFSE